MEAEREGGRRVEGGGGGGREGMCREGEHVKGEGVEGGEEEGGGRVEVEVASERDGLVSQPELPVPGAALLLFMRWKRLRRTGEV